MSDIHLPEIPAVKRTAKQRAIFGCKLLLTIGALGLVFYQADIDKIILYTKDLDWLYAMFGLLVLNVGQIASGLRMRHYFAAAGITLERSFAIALYYVGMLLNLILPGGIGGDGYKAFYLKKKFDFPWKFSLRCIISGRGSGLLLLVILTIILGFFSAVIISNQYAVPLLIIALIGVLPAYYCLAHYLLKESIATQIGAAAYSLIVQGSVIITVILLLKSLGYQGVIIEYLILFQVATIASILPVSIGGIGLREAVFFYGAPVLMLDPELGVTLSLVYFTVNAIASMLGAAAFIYLDKR